MFSIVAITIYRQQKLETKSYLSNLPVLDCIFVYPKKSAKMSNDGNGSLCRDSINWNLIIFKRLPCVWWYKWASNQKLAKNERKRKQSPRRAIFSSFSGVT